MLNLHRIASRSRHVESDPAFPIPDIGLVELCPVAGPFAAVAGPLFGFKAVDVLWVSTGVIVFRPETW
jgi:hypothetical protein